MKKGMIGKKIGMTQVFDEKGNVALFRDVRSKNKL